MTLKQCYLIRNNCYKANIKFKPDSEIHIVVHSTGCNNKTLKRYVQPVPGQKCYEELIEDLGKNIYANHWNTPQPKRNGKPVSTCVAAFIGENAKGIVETIQTLPFDICSYGCGSGKNGSFNYNPTPAIQFEICEDNLKDEVYFKKAFTEAVQLSAYLCRAYSIPVKNIHSHHEAYKLGYANDHGDCDHWLKKFGYTMSDFRNWVTLALNNKPLPIESKNQKYKVICTALTIRQKATTLSKAVGYLKKDDTVLITEVKGTWGCIADGSGWVGLKEKYIRKV